MSNKKISYRHKSNLFIMELPYIIKKKPIDIKMIEKQSFNNDSAT